MKKINAIIREVKQTRQKINELEEKTKQLQNTYLNIMDIKERHEKRKTVENKIVKLEEKKKDLQITIKILNSNAKIALYNEVMPQVLEVLAKYKNKPYGPKTEEKDGIKLIELNSESYKCFFNADNLKKICDILGTTELVMRLYGEMKAALVIDEKTDNQAVIVPIRKYC